MSVILKRAPDRGFTIVELTMVMLIVGILMAIGIPSFKYVTNSNRMAGEVNALLGDLQTARAEAVKEGLPVSVCPSSNGNNCLTATPSAWQQGWIVFLDSNNNKTKDATEAVVRWQKAFTSSDTFVADNNALLAVTFNRLGYASTGATVPVRIILHSSPANSQWTRCLSITSVGVVTVTRPTTDAGCT